MIPPFHWSKSSILNPFRSRCYIVYLHPGDMANLASSCKLHARSHTLHAAGLGLAASVFLYCNWISCTLSFAGSLFVLLFLCCALFFLAPNSCSAQSLRHIRRTHFSYTHPTSNQPNGTLVLSMARSHKKTSLEPAIKLPSGFSEEVVDIAGVTSSYIPLPSHIPSIIPYCLYRITVETNKRES